MSELRISRKSNSRVVIIGFTLLVLSSSMFFPSLLSAIDSTNNVLASTISQNTDISLSAIDVSDTWINEEYVSAIDNIFSTLNYFNLSKYGGGWQYEVTRDWTDRAFTYGKFIGQDSECIMGLLAAYNLTSDQKYLNYAEDIWNWDQVHFWDDVYGGYYVRLNQDNSIAIGDKGMFEHGWFGLATAELYTATGNTSYLNCIADIYSFVTDYFYDPIDGSYFGALTRSLSVSVSDIDTNWVAPYARFLTTSFRETANTTYGDKATELIDNILEYAFDPTYGWIVNRVSPDWSSFTDTAKGWYDVLQTFIDAYQVFGNSSYLSYAQSFFDDIQQANSTAGYLQQMNRDWTSSVNNELLGEEDPGVAIAYLRIASELGNSSIAKEAFRYKDAIFSGLHDPVYDGIYRRIYSGGSQSTWKQWCGAGRVMEMLAIFASINLSISSSNDNVLVWGDSDPNGAEVAGRTIAENLEQAGFNVTFVSSFTNLETELTTFNYSVLVLVAMPWSDEYSNIPSSTENVIESKVANGTLGLVGFHDIILTNANNPTLETIFGGSLTNYLGRDSTYTITNATHPVTQDVPASFLLDDDQLLWGTWDLGVDVLARADYSEVPVVVSKAHGLGKSVYIAAGGDQGYSNAISHNDTNLVKLYTNAVSWVGSDTFEKLIVPSQTNNMALYFDGSDEVVVPSDTTLNPTSGITVMAWIKADDWDGNRRIVQKGVDDQYRLIDEGALEFSLAGVSGADIETPLPSTGVWHHIAGTYDGSTIRLYVDGVESASQSVTGPIQTSSTSLYVGNKPLSSYSGDFFKGIIDEVRIYNRGLSDQEINDTMTNESPASSGLVLFLSFDTLDGTTCPDLSGYGNNGTNYGADIVTSFDWDDVNPELPPIVPPDEVLPPIPWFHQHPLGVANSPVSISWSLPLESDENDFEYELEISYEEDFSDASSLTTAQTSHLLNMYEQEWYYFRVRSVNGSLHSDWSETTKIAYMSSMISINDLEDVAYIENSEYQFIIWDIDSRFCFNYTVHVNDEIQDSGFFREDNVTFSIAGFTFGAYNISLTVIDLAGRIIQSDVELSIQFDPSETLSFIGTTSLIGFIIFMGCIVIYKKYPRKNWKDSVRMQLETTGIMSLETLATTFDISVSALSTYLDSVDFAILSASDSVYSSQNILDEVRNEQLHEGKVEITRFIEEHSLDRAKFIALIVMHSEEFILTDHYVYDKALIIEELKERLLKTNTLDIDAYNQEREIEISVVTSLLNATGLRYYSENDRIFKCIDFEGHRIINQALENGFVFVSQVIEDSSLPLKELISFLSLRRDVVVYSSSLDLLVSMKWLSTMRKVLDEEGEVRIDSLAEKHGISLDNMLAILQYFLQGKVSADKQVFSVEARKTEPDRAPPTSRWTQPSVRSAYHASPPPVGIKTQAPIIKAGESGIANCIAVFGCIWLIFSLILIFTTPFGSAAIAVTAFLGILWKHFSEKGEKKPVRGRTIYETGRELPDGRFMCPYCTTPRKYIVEEKNDEGAVYCKECRAIFPLEGMSQQSTRVTKGDTIEPASITYDTEISSIEKKRVSEKELSKRDFWLFLLGLIGVGLVVVTIILRYYYYLLIIELDTIFANQVVYVASSLTSIVGSLLLAGGLFALREKYHSHFFSAAIVLALALPARFFVGPILFGVLGMMYIPLIYFTQFLMLLFIGLGIREYKGSSKNRSLWDGSWVVVVVWAVIDSLLPLFLGGVYSRASIDVIYLPGIAMNIIGGFLVCLIFLSEIEVLDPNPIVRAMGEIGGIVVFIGGLGLLFLGLLSWVIYIPVFSETWLGEIIGVIAIVIGGVLMSDD